MSDGITTDELRQKYLIQAGQKWCSELAATNKCCNDKAITIWYDSYEQPLKTSAKSLLFSRGGLHCFTVRIHEDGNVSLHLCQIVGGGRRVAKNPTYIFNKEPTVHGNWNVQGVSVDHHLRTAYTYDRAQVHYLNSD
jgi:hypothetical protein